MAPQIPILVASPSFMVDLKRDDQIEWDLGNTRTFGELAIYMAMKTSARQSIGGFQMHELEGIHEILCDGDKAEKHAFIGACTRSLKRDSSKPYSLSDGNCRKIHDKSSPSANCEIIYFTDRRKLTKQLPKPQSRRPVSLLPHKYLEVHQTTDNGVVINSKPKLVRNVLKCRCRFFKCNVKCILRHHRSRKILTKGSSNLN
ncbi:hypothetical protein PIB30_037007 [Stylosanthes scabra]|uniref:Uncharacterized protein n=1 Tax=Stylosanthes scabra TaxID=79078 RepID=A0ABU6QD23_9FABA|nr:hypothetical protein [Stylosanthes scabra]